MDEHRRSWPRYHDIDACRFGRLYSAYVKVQVPAGAYRRKTQWVRVGRWCRRCQAFLPDPPKVIGADLDGQPADPVALPPS